MVHPDGPVAPLVRIGILTHNAVHHTERCLRSIRAHTGARWSARVLDNASTDSTPSYLAALRDPRIEIECLRENRGVGGGRNRLLQQMLREMQDDELLVFLDNDIEVGPGWDRPFLDAFAAMPGLGVAGRWAFSMLVHDGWRDILAEHNGDDGPVDTVQGCCFWIRAGAARMVGGFDERLGRFWHEDDDFCIRALHAGWDVRRVRCADIVHHEHGSGVALHADRLAGSLANQAYLVRKWRALDAIDADGRPRRPIPDPTAPLQRHLAQRLGRGTALLRTEASAAVEDATRLMHAEISDCRATTLATPASLLLLGDAANEGHGDVRDRAAAARARIASLLASRRAESAASPPRRAGLGAFSAICNPMAWDDARWFKSFNAHFRDGRGRDFYARTEMDWRDGQLMHALQVTGALAASRRALVLGHPSERTIAALSHCVAELVVCDTSLPTFDAVAAMAQRTLGDGRLSFAEWPVAAPTDGDFDIVLCPNASRYAPPSRAEALLGALGAMLRPDGWLGVGVSVRLTGPANGRWVERSQLADDGGLREAGLRRIGRFDDTMTDELLLAAVPPDENHHWRPRLSRHVPPHRVALATLFCQRIGAR
jgi:GT2 family glycosyltransferase/SAM-dependent methyltransferase